MWFIVFNRTTITLIPAHSCSLLLFSDMFIANKHHNCKLMPAYTLLSERITTLLKNIILHCCLQHPQTHRHTFEHPMSEDMHTPWANNAHVYNEHMKTVVYLATNLQSARRSLSTWIEHFLVWSTSSFTLYIFSCVARLKQDTEQIRLSQFTPVCFM